ncbi:hypothetical protein DP939_31515 [Spongiactinospora rosea]|uniref:Uncharacterized protein n=1 Tax=Spongiactinospora rosea TaxID=2248750 RepID=A0A366LQI0_9ACTN|nr:hypothetical protein [Spongiactinospora rosea]RBQ16151.1 hypothetical protein DP939_31515 [Spongiactinospora rosea]
MTLVTGKVDFVWWAVVRESAMEGLTGRWWVVLVLAPVVAVQAWAYWQVLRGPVRGDSPPRDRWVMLLRWAIYLNVAWSFVEYTVFPWTWWQSALSSVWHLGTVVLFFLVLRSSRWLRLAVLVGGTLSGLAGITDSVVYGLGSPEGLLFVTRWYDLFWLAWMLPILVAQVRDPRWSRGTVGFGVLSVVMGLLHPSAFIVAYGYDQVPVELLVWSLFGALNVFGMIWQARSAHDLASPLPAAPPRRVRATARWWPWFALAVVLPMVPAAVNLARGMPFWHGPRGEIERFIREDGGVAAVRAWFALDVLVGVGVPALLILAAVLLRTRRLLRGTVLVLVLTATVGVIGVLTNKPDSWDPIPGALAWYPESLFVRDQQIVLTGGISPLWFSAALAASAFILFLLYAPAPAERPRHHVLLAALASAVLVTFLPTAAHSRGPVTTAADCEPRQDQVTFQYEEPKLTTAQRFVCRTRKDPAFKYVATAPDRALLAHGRQLCGIYTRNDPQEVARLRAWQGLQRDALTYPLAPICPRAAAVVKAAEDARNKEFAEWEADAQRMCDATPRHRPLIKPAKATRVTEPQRTDYGVMEAYGTPEDDYDPADMSLLDKAQDNGLVAARPGHVLILTDSDTDVCVTVETYARRPPVETKGWDHVVEVGYRKAGGSIVLADQIAGGEGGLPDLALDGYQGPYRIRVHYAWFPWEGEQGAGQRLLVMAFPGKSDKVVTYRKPGRRP